METWIIKWYTIRWFGKEFQQLSIQSGVLVPRNDGIKLLEMKREEENDLEKRVPRHTFAIQNYGKTIPSIHQPAGIKENSDIMELDE